MIGTKIIAKINITINAITMPNLQPNKLTRGSFVEIEWPSLTRSGALYSIGFLGCFDRISKFSIITVVSGFSFFFQNFSLSIPAFFCRASSGFAPGATIPEGGGGGGAVGVIVGACGGVEVFQKLNLAFFSCSSLSLSLACARICCAFHCTYLSPSVFLSCFPIVCVVCWL